MRILMLGDIIGKPGRQAVKSVVPGLRRQHRLDMVIANAENAAGGLGLTPATAQELLSAGVDVLTSGNHIWDKKEIIPYLEKDVPLIRPLNYPQGVPGRGYLVRHGVLVVNLMGRIFMDNLDCPFRGMDKLLAELVDRPRIVVVDFHAEATSEKGAMGWYLDGRVSAVLGTHTHVGTTDARILPGGTAFVTDVGMVGPIDSIIGDDKEAVIRRFLTRLPHRLSVGRGQVLLSSVMVEVEGATGLARDIQRLNLTVAEGPDESGPSSP